VRVAKAGWLIRSGTTAGMPGFTYVYRLRSQHNPAQAIGALRQLKPDAVNLDLRLPDGNGLEVLHGMAQLRGLSR